MQHTFQNKLLINTVMPELNQASMLLNNVDNLHIDLNNITHIDSAGIALLIELKSIAKQQNKQLFYDNPTPDILRLCKLYQVNI